MASSNLNLDKFRKVVNLARHKPHDDGSHNQHQIDAAWAQAARMADVAGLTLEIALSKLDTRYLDPDSFIDEIFAEMGAKQRQAAKRPWPEHELEVALQKALRGHSIDGMGLRSDELPDETLSAIRGAIPWPQTMRQAVAEHEVWDDIEFERQRKAEHYRLGDGPLIRRFMLQDFLEGVAATPADAVVRARWLSKRKDGSDRQRAEWMTLITADMERMYEALKKSRSGRGEAEVDEPAAVTNQEKRDRVRAVLSEPGGMDLSLREVARRVGVSVQHVANVRKAMAEDRQR